MDVRAQQRAPTLQCQQLGKASQAGGRGGRAQVGKERCVWEPLYMEKGADGEKAGAHLHVAHHEVHSTQCVGQGAYEGGVGV